MRAQLALLLILFVAFQSCKKTIGNKAFKANSTMTYKVDGRQVTIAGDLASINANMIGAAITYTFNTSWQGKFKTFTIHGRKELEDMIEINLKTEQLEQKEYIIKPAEPIDIFNYCTLNMSTGSFGLVGDSSIMRITITQISGITVYGTFSGTVGKKGNTYYNLQDELVTDYEYHKITEGEFKEVKIVE